MLVSTPIRTLAAAALVAFLAGCSGTTQMPAAGSPGQAATQSLHSAHTKGSGLMGAFANPKLNALAAAHRAAGGLRTQFKALRPFKKSQPNWVIASSEFGGYLDVLDVNTRQLIASCDGCGGWGVSVNRKNGDLAVGTQYSSVSVYHQSDITYFTPYANLLLTSNNGFDPLGVAYDSKGGVYVGNLLSNEIDYFSAATIAAGGGYADLKLYPKDLYQVYFLATDGNTLIANGVQPGSDAIVTVSVKPTAHGTSDKVLQSSPYGTAFPGGLAVDQQHNLTINNQLGTIAVYAKPWTGTPIRSLDWYDGGYSDFTGIALNKDQLYLYWADVNNDYDFSYVVQDTYNPISWYGSFDGYFDKLYIGVAADPAAL